MRNLTLYNMRKAHTYNNNAWFARAGRFMREAHPIKFTVILVVALNLILLPIQLLLEFDILPDYQFRPEPLDMLKTDPWGLFFSAVIFAPLIETLLNQMLPWFVLRRFKTVRRHRIIAVAISGLIFGALHFYSVVYILITVVMGMVMMWAYIVKYRKNPYWNVVLFHAVWNGLAMLLTLLTT